MDALNKKFRTEADAAPNPLIGDFGAEFPNLHRIQSCEICTHVNKTIWDFICQYQYKIIVERDEQERFARRGGFCPFHTWEYESVASPYGACNGYPNLLDRLSNELRAAGSASANNNETFFAKLQSLLPTREDCVLCVVRDKAEQECIATTAKGLEGAKTVRCLVRLSAFHILQCSLLRCTATA
jgi:hypothetical protein